MSDGNGEKRINNTLSEWTIEKVLDKQKDLEKSDLEIVEKIEKLSKEQQEKFDLILSKLDEIVEKWKSEASSEIVVDDDAASLTASVDSIQNLEENEEMISTSGKYFVLKHTFNNVSSFENGTDYFSEKEEHFGVRWQISVERCDGFLSLYLYTSLLKKTEKKWEIEVENEKKIVSRGKKEKSGNKTSDVFKSDDDSCGWGESEFIEWDEVEKHFLVDDSICVEIAVKVRKMTGIYKENVRSFDKTMEECSDVVLIVNDEKFYVSKLKYLEVLYAESAINDYAVEGILMVADMYDTRLVIHKCENFLKKTSKKNLKKKLQLSIRYNLASLRKQCLEEIKTVADIKSLIPGDIRSLDSSILVELFEKSLSFHNSDQCSL